MDIPTKYHQNRPRNFGSIEYTRFVTEKMDRRTDGRTDSTKSICLHWKGGDIKRNQCLWVLIIWFKCLSLLLSPHKPGPLATTAFYTVITKDDGVVFPQAWLNEYEYKYNGRKTVSLFYIGTQSVDITSLCHLVYASTTQHAFTASYGNSSGLSTAWIYVPVTFLFV